MKSNSTWRLMVGCWLHERWRGEFALSQWLSARWGVSWVDLCNRRERLAAGSDPGARLCLWRDSSWLTVARIFPRFGGRLLRHCLALWPIPCASPTAGQPRVSPVISVVLPISGTERVPQLQAVLANLMAQQPSACEIIVSEEGQGQSCLPPLPDTVRHVFTQRPKDKPYCKSRMLNAGAAVAKGRHLLLHDADILVPERYLDQIVERLDAGWEAVRPIRFLFCLGKEETDTVLKARSCDDIPTVPDIMQNFPGGSVALRRDTYLAIGGMDEDFAGWGGEDNEFLDRLDTRNVFQGGFLPAIHLWHPPQTNKGNTTNPMHSLLARKREQTPEQRIHNLAKCKESTAT